MQMDQDEDERDSLNDDPSRLSSLLPIGKNKQTMRNEGGRTKTKVSQSSRRDIMTSRSPLIDQVLGRVHPRGEGGG